jgi:hypothetical protein
MRAITFEDDGESIGITQGIGDHERSSLGDTGKIGDDVACPFGTGKFDPCSALNLMAEFVANGFESVIKKCLRSERIRPSGNVKLIGNADEGDVQAKFLRVMNL